jgi:hypothetical protein
MTNHIKPHTHILLILVLLLSACTAQKELSLITSSPKIEIWQCQNNNWIAINNSFYDRKADTMAYSKGEGMLYNAATSPSNSLISKFEHSDCDLHLEVMLPPNGKSSVLLQGRYQIMLNDSNDDSITTSMHTIGAINSAINTSLFSGVVPLANMANPAGAWNSIDITFQAPQFSWNTKKLTNAIIQNIKINGVTVQQNVSIAAPSQDTFFPSESFTGPLILLANSKGVVFKNLILKFSL